MNGNHRTRHLQCTLPQRGLPCSGWYFLKHEGFREDCYPSKGEARRQAIRPATPRATSNLTADARRHSPQNRCGAEDQVSAVGLFTTKRTLQNNADSSEQHGLLGTTRLLRNKATFSSLRGHFETMSLPARRSVAFGAGIPRRREAGQKIAHHTLKCHIFSGLVIMCTVGSKAKQIMATSKLEVEDARDRGVCQITELPYTH